jgi:hypothetical protein
VTMERGHVCERCEWRTGVGGSEGGKGGGGV